MLRVIKKIVFYFIVFIFTSFLIFVGYLISNGRDAAILMYHSVGQSYKEDALLEVPLDIFEKQMKFLREHKYNVISLEKLAEMIEIGESVPPKTVVLTFDDGYEDNYTRVFPVLKKYNLPATIFVIVNYLGKERHMGERSYKFMTVEMLKEMSDSGLVTFGSHTLDHVFLPEIKDRDELKRQLYDSKNELEKLTGKPVNLFCYPVGGYNPVVENMVKELGFKAAVTTFPKHGFAHNDLYALKRIKPSRKSLNIFTFFIKTSGYYLRIEEMNR